MVYALAARLASGQLHGLFDWFFGIVSSVPKELSSHKPFGTMITPVPIPAAKWDGAVRLGIPFAAGNLSTARLNSGFDENGLVQKRLRTRKASTSSFGTPWGMHSQVCRKHQRPLTLTVEERTNLAAIVEKWINLPVTSDDDRLVLFGTRFGTHEGVLGLQCILPEIDLSSSVAKVLFAKVAAMNKTNTPGFRLYFCLARFLPDRLDDIAVSMRMGLSSNDATVAEEAVLGLYAWLTTALEKAAPALPSDLLREVGVVLYRHSAEERP